MTEHKKVGDVNDPRNQVAAQTTNQDAGPGEPGHYTAPTVDTITKSPPNEVKPPADKARAKEGDDDFDYEALTVPELKDLAEQRGIEVKSDDRKDDIIAALQAG